ncbi:MAG: dihydropteroate synthase [Vicingaceae bacterium]
MQNQDENSAFMANYSIQIRGNLIDLSTPRIMGIINLTPDSFYAQSRQANDQALLKKCESMINEGATFLDLGAFSSRPGAEMISEKEEKVRLLTALQKIRNTFPEVYLSIDTYRSSIARLAINEGADAINDISGGLFDDNMFETMAELQTPYFLMHMKGEPKSMQHKPQYENVFTEIFAFFKKQIDQLNRYGVKDVILDPGFGFGKSLAHNYSLLRNLAQFHALNCPLLVGLSRKGMIQKVIHQDADRALNGTTAAHVLALLNGAQILRVHDVKAAKEAIQIVDFYQKQ